MSRKDSSPEECAPADAFPENAIISQLMKDTTNATAPVTLGLLGAAAFLHMSPNTLRKRAAAGRVLAYKPGKSWVFMLDELVSHLKASRPCHSIAATTLRTTWFGFRSTDAKSGLA